MKYYLIVGTCWGSCVYFPQGRERVTLRDGVSGFRGGRVA